MSVLVAVSLVASFVNILLHAEAVDYKYQYGIVGSPQSLGSYCNGQLSGAEWLLNQRSSDYGWGEDTHRALIALAIDQSFDWPRRQDSEFMIIRLHEELIKAMSQNKTYSMPLGDLALYVHAFLAVGIDPRDFYGEDLVAMLQHSFLHETYPHPFSVLALCNAKALDNFALQRIFPLINSNFGSEYTESKAIAVKAFACAFSEWPDKYGIYEQRAKETAAELAKTQNTDGSFGNLCTTSIIVQALIATGEKNWQVHQAMEFLHSNISEDISILSTYCGILAVNSERVNFIKDLGKKSDPYTTIDGFPSVSELRSRRSEFPITYALMSDINLQSHFSYTVNVPVNATFFDVMRLASDEDPIFRFNYTLNVGQPDVYSISGIPNDVENGYFWRLISTGQVERPKDPRVPSAKYYLHQESVNRIIPKKDSYWQFKYIHAYSNDKRIGTW